jgi:tetratricopeptide (TPR) repeat protein
LWLAAACRAEPRIDDLRYSPSGPEPFGPSFALGHRFGRWLEVVPDPSARSALERACLLEQRGAKEEAMAVLSDALEEHGASASLFEARGALYLAAGFPRAAAGDFQRAVGLAAGRASAWFALGHAYELLGLSRQALDALDRAGALGADHPELYLSRARVSRALGRCGSAAREYQHALERLPGRPTEVFVEVAVLAKAEAGDPQTVDAVRERLESCREKRLSDDAWLLRALLKELPRESPAEIGTALRALEVDPEELAELAHALLEAVQLVDPETSTAARAELLANEPDARRRAALERCLAQLPP